MARALRPQIFQPDLTIFLPPPGAIESAFRQWNSTRPAELLPVTHPVRGGFLNRRDFLQVSAALPLVASTARGLFTPAQAQPAPFDRSIVRQLARDAAGKPFKASDSKLPDHLNDLDYDHYRAETVGSSSLWLGKITLPAGKRTRAHVHEHHENRALHVQRR
jgi:hypothetical protein